MMSFYEWVLVVERYSVKAEQRKFEWETGWDQTRRTMAMLGNMFRGQGSLPLRPEDFIKLSWDNTQTDRMPQTQEEAKELFEFVRKRFGSKIPKKLKKNGE